jgi:hypothetical protein
VHRQRQGPCPLRVRVAKRAAIMVGRYTHAHQFKRARRQLKFLHTRLGRIIRDIRRKIAVRQNLMLGIKDTRRPGKWRLEDMLKMFPNLADGASRISSVFGYGRLKSWMAAPSRRNSGFDSARSIAAVTSAYGGSTSTLIHCKPRSASGSGPSSTRRRRG